MSLFSLTKKVFDKHVGHEDTSADSKLPFQAKLGSLVTLNISPFLRAVGTLVSTPDRSQPVVAISRVRTELSGSLYRYYLDKGDTPQDKETYIQIYVDAKGDVGELYYFQRLLRMFPETEDDCALFLGTTDSGLGQLEFSLSKSQLSDIGVAADLLDGAFVMEEQLAYKRQTGGEAAYVQPFEGIENRIDDSQGEKGLRQKVLFMPYLRTLQSGVIEQLFIETEILNEKNGDAVQDVHVDFMLGLALSANDVRIQ